MAFGLHNMPNWDIGICQPIMGYAFQIDVDTTFLDKYSSKQAVSCRVSWSSIFQCKNNAMIIG